MLRHVESIVLFVADIEAAARWYAGRAAMLIDPFGCTLGLNASSAGSRARIAALAGPAPLPP